MVTLSFSSWSLLLKSLILASVIFLAASSLLPHSTLAEEPARESNTSSFALEIDPLVFTVFQGYGLHLLWKPANSQHLIYGLSLVSGLRLPDDIMEHDPNNNGKGWHLAVNQGFGLFTEYYFSEVHRDWLVGLQLITQEIELTNDNYPGRKNATNTGTVVLHGGYHWKPFGNKIPIYLKPWAGIGYTSILPGTFEPNRVTPDTKIGDLEYKLPNLIVFGAVHVGYDF